MLANPEYDIGGQRSRSVADARRQARRDRGFHRWERREKNISGFADFATSGDEAQRRSVQVDAGIPWYREVYMKTNRRLPIEELITRVQAARLLHRSPRTLKTWAWLRKGPSFWKNGTRCLYARSEITDWMKKSAVRMNCEGGTK